MREIKYEVKKLTADEEDKKYVEAFKSYCLIYGSEHDESFTLSDSMDEFVLDDANPTYMLLDEGNTLVGAVSLMMTEYYQRGNRGRVRILHSTTGEAEAYKTLIEAAKQHLGNLNHFFLYIPLRKEKTMEMFTSFGMEIERYAYYMERGVDEIPGYHFPEGFELRDLMFGKEEPWWCKVRNAAFANLAGSNTPVTEGEIAEMEDRQDHLPGGMKLLWKDGEAIGAVGIQKDDDDGEKFANIGPVAVNENFRGMGLGRNLLRYGLSLAKESGFKKAGLNVNAENTNAAKLYLSEGFQEVMALACFHLK